MTRSQLRLNLQFLALERRWLSIMSSKRLARGAAVRGVAMTIDDAILILEIGLSRHKKAKKKR